MKVGRSDDDDKDGESGDCGERCDRDGETRLLACKRALFDRLTFGRSIGRSVRGETTDAQSKKERKTNGVTHSLM